MNLRSVTAKLFDRRDVGFKTNCSSRVDSTASPLSRVSCTHRQMFKVVLSKVFDLRCNLEEITGAGEPLLLFLKDEGMVSRSGGSGST